ncbi:MAG: hypothetical protein JO010_04805 [Alphaproteobacteria bacterium]|nr:hypothetical protein [Alphaproteobacteria bacterium]
MTPSSKASDEMPRAVAAQKKRDAAARRDMANTQQAMRELLARLPRRFAYADEIDPAFRPDHEA